MKWEGQGYDVLVHYLSEKIGGPRDFVLFYCLSAKMGGPGDDMQVPYLSEKMGGLFFTLVGNGGTTGIFFTLVGRWLLQAREKTCLVWSTWSPSTESNHAA